MTRSKKPTLRTAPDSPSAKQQLFDDKDNDNAKTSIRDTGPMLPTGFDGDTVPDSDTYIRVDPRELHPVTEPADSGNFKREASTPIQVISMKPPGHGPDRDTPQRVIPKVKLRQISDVAPGTGHESLGYLAPPANPADMRSRQRRELVLWGSVCVILASIVALVIWFVAR